MHLKKYDQWNIQKQLLNQKERLNFIRERDIVFIAIGENIGHEQSGKGKQFLRPVLVYKKFSRFTFLGIPLTRNLKKGRFYFSFTFKNKVSNAVLSQIRLFDTKRIEYVYGRLDEKSLLKIKKKLIKLLQ